MTSDPSGVPEQRSPSSLSDITIDQITDGKKQVVALEHNMSIAQAMKTLAQAGVLSAPVFISPDLEDLGSLHEETPKSELLGWMDMNDVLSSFLKHVEGKHPHRPAMLQLMAILDSEGPEFTSRPIITVMGGNDKSLMYKGDADTPLLNAIRSNFLQDGKRAVHRIGIFDNKGEVVKVVSQMDVLQYLTQHPHLLGALEAETLLSTGLLQGAREIAAVDINTPTLNALQHMHSQGHSSVAVLSPDNCLITNLSSSDLRYIQADHLGVLALPVGEFLGILHRAVYLGFSTHGSEMSEHKFFARAHERQPVPLITCTAGTLLLTAMQRMVEKRVHRIYVVDDETSQMPKPLAIVTPTDILKLISQRAAQ